MLSAEPHWANREASGEPSYGRSLFNYFRDYDPQTGRYLETDPIGLQDGPNLFIYARGSPLRYIDRNGGAVDDLWGWGFPTEDEHFNRNRNNYCPKRPPKDCPGWDQDEGALGTKYRSDRGFECAYDQNGRLLPDITKWNWLGFQNYSFNYGAGRFPWTPRHVWQDFIPHFLPVPLPQLVTGGVTAR